MEPIQHLIDLSDLKLDNTDVIMEEHHCNEK